MAVERIADATSEPLSLSEAKTHLRVTSPGEDTYVTGLIKAARKRAERFTRSGFLKQTWRDTRDMWPVSDEWTLERGPMFSSTGVVVRYRPQGSTSATTFSSTNYIVDDRSLFGRIVLKEGVSWPSTNLQQANGVEAEWEVGYGSTRSDVPEDLRHALKLMIGSNFDHREDIVVGSQVVEMPNSATHLLWGHRVPEVP